MTMERTMTLTIFTVFAIVGVGLIILFLSQWKDEIQGNVCVSQACVGRTNGETFCNEAGDNMMRCVLDEERCLKEVSQVCACEVDNDGIAFCS